MQVTGHKPPWGGSVCVCVAFSILSTALVLISFITFAVKFNADRLRTKTVRPLIKAEWRKQTKTLECSFVLR